MKTRNIKLLLLALLLSVFSTTIAQEKGLQERINKIKVLLMQNNLTVNNNRPKPIIVTKENSMYIDYIVMKSKLMPSVDENGEIKYRKTPVLAKLIIGERYELLKTKLAVR